MQVSIKLFSLTLSERKVFLVLGDLLMVNLALAVSLLMASASALPAPISPSNSALYFSIWFGALSALWVAAARINDCYNAAAVTRLFTAGSRILSALFGTFLTALVVSYLVQFPPPTGASLLSFFPAALALLLLWRSFFFLVFRLPPFKRRAIIVGAGNAGSSVARELAHSLSGEYVVLGYVDDDPAKGRQVIEGVPVLGDRKSMLQLARSLGVQELVLSITHEIHHELYSALIEAQESGIAVTPMAVLFENITGRVPVEHINDYWYAGLPITPNSSTLYVAAKRSVDLIVSLMGLIGLGVVFPLLALAIRLDSPGPIFYEQERVGRSGRVFRLLKLRSMIADAEPEGMAVWATQNDARVTRIGRFLRVTRMDELPQFINVLLGDMSLVGPRPERPAFVGQLQQEIPFYRTRLLVKPGLTGWAQIGYRYGNSVGDALIKLQYDLYYIKHQSLFLDVLIGLRTFWVVISCKGT